MRLPRNRDGRSWLPRSLRGRLGLLLGLALTLLWLAAASLTAVSLRHEMDEVFDSALQETAQRLLPLAVVDIVGREDDGVTQRLGAIRDHVEFFTYIVRDAQAASCCNPIRPIRASSRSMMARDSARRRPTDCITRTLCRVASA